MPPSVLPPSWMRVLETIEQSLAERLAAVPEVPPAEPLTADTAGHWQPLLDRLEERLAQLEACAAQASQQAAAADALLAADADALAAWRARSASTQQRLAEWASASV